MTDHLDRAAEVIAAQMHGLTTPGMCRGIAQALEEAGLLVSPERDAGVAAKALRDAAADLGRRASDPALIESADRHSGYYAGVRAAMQREIQLLHDRADRIEREAGESDADA